MAASTTLTIASVTPGSLPALTTTFTPNPECLANTGFYYGSNNTAGVGTFSRYPYYTGTTGYTSSISGWPDACYPRGAVVGDNFRVAATFSPGICPSGYGTAYTSVIDLTKTSVQCCPSNFLGAGGSECYSTATYYYVECWRASVGAPCAPTTLEPGVMARPAIEIFYEQKDLVLLITQSSSTSTGRSTPSRSSTTPVSTSRSSSDSNGSGLTPGAQAGIGIGVTFAIILVFMIWLFCACMEGKRSKKQNAVKEASTDGGEWNKPELDGTGMSRDIESAVEIDGVPACYREVDAQDATVTDPTRMSRIVSGHVLSELDTTKVASEMPTTGSPTLSSATTLQGPLFTPITPLPPTSEPEGAPTQNLSLMMAATAPGPVSPTLAKQTQATTKQANIAGDTVDSPPIPSGQSSTISPTIEQVELQYLEAEEKRIKERKEAILRGKAKQ